jgi:GNAT superfamily N-acetyltransferase
MDNLIVATRLATTADAAGIAAAHLDSIHSIGARYYSPEVVADWTAPINGARYLERMQGGEIFYVTVGMVSGKLEVLGFASHRVAKGQHRTAIYIRGIATRTGIGSTLFKLAEARAIAQGATSIHVDSSLAAVEFYQANGFATIGPSAYQLRSGRTMDCVIMQKQLASNASSS